MKLTGRNGLFGNKTKTLAILSGTLAVTLIGSSTYLIVSKNNMEESLRQEILDRDNQIAQYFSDTQEVYVLAKDVKANQPLTSEDYTTVRVSKAATPETGYLTEQDIKGKMLKFEGKINMPISSSMLLTKGPIDNSERYLETDYIRLPYRLNPKDTVDIRILMPTGEDYRVVVKKRLDDADLSSQMLFFKGVEEEILLLDSALVDAYINNGEVYAIQYTDPGIQEPARPNYLPNKRVLALIKSDPSIVDKARYSLAEQLRTNLEETLKNLPDQDKVRIGAQVPEGSGAATRRKTTGAVYIYGNSQQQQQNSQEQQQGQQQQEQSVDPNQTGEQNPQQNATTDPGVNTSQNLEDNVGYGLPEEYGSEE